MKYELVVIGASMGGLRALQTVLSALPATFAAPVAIVQHRGNDADETLTMLLQRKSAMPVVEAEDKQTLEAGYVYLAPPDYHLLVEPGHFALSTGDPVGHARPSIDVLFESAADAYGARAVGVILTGASDDGAQGLGRIHARGGLTIVQDPATAEAPMMPAAARAAVPEAKVLSLEEIGAFLIAAVSGDTSHQS